MRESTISTNIQEGLIADKEEEERLRKELFTQEFKPPYVEQDQNPGSGPFRIGSALARDNGVYSLLFASYFNWELVKKAQEDINVRDNL